MCTSWCLRLCSRLTLFHFRKCVVKDVAVFVTTFPRVRDVQYLNYLAIKPLPKFVEETDISEIEERVRVSQLLFKEDVSPCCAQQRTSWIYSQPHTLARLFVSFVSFVLILFRPLNCFFFDPVAASTPRGHELSPPTPRPQWLPRRPTTTMV